MSARETGSPPQRDLAVDDATRFFEFSLDMFCVLDLEGTILRANSSSLRILGREPHELVGHSYLDFIAPEDHPAAATQLQQLRTGRDATNFECRTLHKDGSTRWLACSCPSPLPGAARLLVICRDITEQKLLRESLAEWKVRYDAAALMGGNVVYELDAETRRLVWGDNFEDTFGDPPGAAVSDLPGWLQRIHPDDRPRVEQALQGALAESEPVHLEYRVRNKDGSCVFVQDDARFFSDARGRRRMIGCLKDISPARRAEERFRKIFESAPTGILLVAAEGRIAMANPAAQRMFGYSHEELVGMEIHQLVPASQRAAHRAYVEGYFRDPRTRPVGSGLRLSAARRDGSEFPVDVALSPIRLGGESLVACTVVDLTDRLIAQEETEKANRRLELILGTINDGILGLDLEGSTIFVNPAAVKMLGAGAEDILGVSHTQVFNLGEPGKGSVSEDAGEYLAAARRGETHRREDKHVRRPDGRSFPIEYVSTPIQEGNRIVGAVVSFRDTTEHHQRLKSEHELISAQRVQKHLYPEESPRIPGFDIAGAVFPATHACGDCFDYIPADEHMLFLAVGDVSGHGLGPALHMVETRAYLRAVLASTQAPGHALAELNRLLIEDILEDAFVTLVLAKLDTQSSTLIYSGAGHEARLMRRGTHPEPLSSTGLVLGVKPDSTFGNAGPIRLQPGDIFLIVTDGFTEARAANRSFFGWEGVDNVVRRNRDRPARKIVGALYDAAQLFIGQGPQSDDMTVVVVKRC